MEHARQFYIGGSWVGPHTDTVLDVVDPATEEPIEAIALGGPADVDDAVAAARAAFPSFASTSRRERLDLLDRIVEGYRARSDELADVVSREMGAPLRLAKAAQVPAGLGHLRTARRVLADYEFERELDKTLVVREPIGVCGLITPWNWPLNQISCKVAPALAAGCTIVLKPAEDTSLTALRLAELLEEAGLPRGVLNVVTGTGAETGAALASHPGVDKIAFTGSTATGRAIIDAAKTNFKRVTLELGGKSPVIVMDDADLELAIPGVANAIFFNGGQVCIAGSRLYAHEKIYDKLVAGVADYARGLKMGHGLDPETQMGPLVSTRHAERVEGFIARARDDGARIVTGGERSGTAGTFIAPTVLADVRPDMEIVREEVFGPVLVAQKFSDLDEVIAAANDSQYGLAASVWTESLSHAHRLSDAIQAGTVWINCHAMYDSALAIGGHKQSGWGRDSGIQALDNYLEWKTVCMVV